MAKEIAEEYASSLADLTVNSKPLINMLTILAEENIEHAGVIVETVEKHLEKVQPDIKLPVLYLVDSIIKNVGGAYTQKFSQSIVNMFTRTFKQVDEKIRSQMFKLRETWHEVFPATKLYQLDVKVSLIDPAWPIQAQPQQSTIHVNPNFLKKNPATTSATPALTEDEEKMRNMLAKKEQELLMLQRKKIEMELEQTRKQLEVAEKKVNKVTTVVPPVPAAAIPPMVNSVVAPVIVPDMPVVQPVPVTLPAKARLGPPVNKPPSGGRIAPVSGALAAARRDPRLARLHPAPAPPVAPVAPIAPNVFDIKPLKSVTKRNNVITIDVSPPVGPPAVPAAGRRRDPRLDKRPERAARGRARDERRDRRKPDEPDRKRDEPRKTDLDGDRDRRKPEVELDRRKPEIDVDRRKPEVDADRRKPEGDVDRRKPEVDVDRRKPEVDVDRRKADVDADRDRRKTDEGVAVAAGERTAVDRYLENLALPDPRKVKLPPIPKINRDEPKDGETPSPVKRRKELVRNDRKKKRDAGLAGKDSSGGSSPEKKSKARERKNRVKEQRMEVEEKPAESEVVAFKELKNYHKERYMRRNKEKSESPETLPQEKTEEEKPAPEIESASMPELVSENKDVDLRILPVVETKPAPVAQKRPSLETLENKNKKNKLDKFDILFGNEDVDLRLLPQVEEVAPPPPSMTASPKPVDKLIENDKTESPHMSPKKDWNEVKEKEDLKKTPSKLDLVRAKLAEATKGKDRLGRRLLYSKSPSVERERRRTLSSEDTDLRMENTEDFDAEDHKKTISIIMTQAKEQFSDGQLDKNQYNALMFQVLQLNEKLKLKEAKQRESLEQSKRKLKAHLKDENHKVVSPKSSPNTFGDIDERIQPLFLDTPPDSQGYLKDSDMRMGMDGVDGGRPVLLPAPPQMPMYMPYPNWRGARGRTEDFPRRFRGPVPPYFRGKFDKRAPRPPFDIRLPIPPLPTPQMGTCQGECPLRPYERSESPPPLGAPGIVIPPTDFNILEYIDRDPVKTIQIDGIPREIRFYGETAVIMLDWDDPREIKFLPGCRRVTFDNKDSVVLSFNEPYKQVEIDDQIFNIRFGAPTRELYINGRWFECFFGGQPLGVLIDGKPRLVHLEGPLPQVDIGKTKRTDLVAGKINLIVNATQMCPVYLDAKVQKFMINGHFFTIRFVDALRTVLINEQPFKVEYGDLPKPIFVGNEKFFIRFSALPRHIKPGYVQIADMEGSGLPTLPIVSSFPSLLAPTAMEVDPPPAQRPPKTPSPEGEKGLDMLASVMPSSMGAPASASEYSLAEPLFFKTDKIPGLETPSDVKPTLPALENINVTDLFAKLVATGIVPMPIETKTEPKEEPKEEVKPKPKEDKNVIHKVDLLKPETLRIKQPALVARLYGGMQCSGCGARFPPEHTVRYSQHLDWHFRQNRRERDSARRAHSRHWHYDLCDWVQYEEIEDLEEREKSWFETGGAEGEGEGPQETAEEAPSVAAGAPADHFCALCGDKFDQFYNEDKEEWHLRNSVRHDGNNYHPLCFDDYKASLTKEEPPQENADDVVAVDKPEVVEAIEIKDADEIADESDNESVVEVVEPEEQELPEPVEIEEGEEDDVVLEAQPVEQVTVEDDADTDDETAAEREERDRLAAIEFANVKIKQEPIDPDDEPIITAEEESLPPVVDTTHTTVLSSIDGNVQLEAAPTPATTLPIGGIRINISKSLPSFVTNNQDDKMLEDISADDEPLPPGEEPELEYTLKPSLQGVHFSRQPPVQRGNELSALCSIM